MAASGQEVAQMVAAGAAAAAPAQAVEAAAPAQAVAAVLPEPVGVMPPPAGDDLEDAQPANTPGQSEKVGW